MTPDDDRRLRKRKLHDDKTEWQYVIAHLQKPSCVKSPHGI